MADNGKDVGTFNSHHMRLCWHSWEVKSSATQKWENNQYFQKRSLHRVGGRWTGWYCTWAGARVEVGGVEDKRVWIWAEVTEGLATQREWQGERERMTAGEETRRKRGRAREKNNHKGKVSRHTDRLTYLPPQISESCLQNGRKYRSACITRWPGYPPWHLDLFPWAHHSHPPLC